MSNQKLFAVLNLKELRSPVHEFTVEPICHEIAGFYGADEIVVEVIERNCDDAYYPKNGSRKFQGCNIKPFTKRLVVVV